MKNSENKSTSPVDKLLKEIKDDLKARKHVNPQMYRENVAYFQRQAELMG